MPSNEVFTISQYKGCLSSVHTTEWEILFFSFSFQSTMTVFWWGRIRSVFNQPKCRFDPTLSWITFLLAVPKQFALYQKVHCKLFLQSLQVQICLFVLGGFLFCFWFKLSHNPSTLSIVWDFFFVTVVDFSCCILSRKMAENLQQRSWVSEWNLTLRPQKFDLKVTLALG